MYAAYDSANIFAKILRNELPCIKLFEDDATIAIMDIMPQADGHVLVIPKEAAVGLLDLSPEAASAAIRTVQKLAKAVRDALQPAGLFIAQANGAPAGQTIPHCHFHIIPNETGKPFRPHAVERADDALLRDYASKIIAALEKQ
ncbi:MAG: HIT family protein [Janthinobacterium lividum]